MGNGRDAATPTAMRVEVLGPLRLSVGGGDVEVPGPKRRALLALLALAHGRLVSIDELLESMWPGEPPYSARATLRSHLSRLRNHLGPCAHLLESGAGGYRLHVADERRGTDLAEARALLDEAQVASTPEAFDLLARARSLWRGPPLIEFDDVDRLRSLAVALDELRHTVEETFTAAAIELGRPGEAVAAATALASDFPLSEPAALLKVRSLDAAGRPAEALRVAYDHRRSLRQATGLEASPMLADVEQSIAGRRSARPGRVPRAPRGLRGRERELAMLRRLLVDERLVTVTGPGGVGKTRLAIEAAAGVEEAVCLWLAPVTTGRTVPRALAEALDLRVIHGDPMDACAALLAAGPWLLLLDNCEHLLPEVRDVARRLLDTCPGLTILATSLHALDLPDEHRLRLRPLDWGRDQAPHLVAPAIAVFVDRAQKIQPQFSPTDRDLAVIGEIVQRLDGMPLTIELAASRLSSLDLEDLRSRLSRRLDLLGGGLASTLRETLEWSYDLLGDGERRLLRYLSRFPHGFDLATAEMIADGIGLAGDGAATLSELVDSSMVEVGPDRPVRYRMLETIRTFARDRLADADEEADAVDQLLAWASHVLQDVDRAVLTGDEAGADRVIRCELGNLGVAWDAAQAHHRTDDAVRIVIALGEPASWRDLTDVAAWVLELADSGEIAAHRHVAAVLGLAAGFAWARGELARAEHLARCAIEEPGDHSWARNALALVALSRGALERAILLGTEAAAAPHTAHGLGIAALAASYLGQHGRATALHDAFQRASDRPTHVAFHRYVGGELASRTGRIADAEHDYRQAIDGSRRIGAAFVEGIASVGLLTLRSRSGSVDGALRSVRDLIDYWEGTGGWLQQWTTLRNLATLLRGCGDEETALFLAAASTGARDAPAVTDGPTVPHPRLDAARAARIREQAESCDRSEVLAAARRAIDRLLPGDGGTSAGGADR